MQLSLKGGEGSSAEEAKKIRNSLEKKSIYSFCWISFFLLRKVSANSLSQKRGREGSRELSPLKKKGLNLSEGIWMGEKERKIAFFMGEIEKGVSSKNHPNFTPSQESCNIVGGGGGGVPPEGKVSRYCEGSSHKSFSAQKKV